MMNLVFRKLLTFATLGMFLAGCASDQRFSPQSRAAVHRVAVNHAVTIAAQEHGTTTGRIAGSIARQGAAYGLGIVGLGLVGGLAMNAADIARTPRNGEVSQQALQVLSETRADAGALIVRPMERELARKGFTVDSKTADAAFQFELVSLKLVPADALKLRQRPVLAVRATLLSGKGKILWRKLATETALRIATIRVQREGQEGVAAFLEKRAPDWT